MTLYWSERVVNFELNWPCTKTRGSFLHFDLVLRREGRCSSFWPCTETRGSLFFILTLYLTRLEGYNWRVMTEILTVSQIAHHNLKSNLRTMSLRLYNRVVETYRWYLKKFVSTVYWLKILEFYVDMHECMTFDSLYDYFLSFWRCMF